MAVPKKKEQATKDELVSFIKENDFKLWFRKTKVKEAAEKLSLKIGKRVNRAVFASAIEEAAMWWKKKPRKSETMQKLLTEEQWNNLRNTIIAHRNEIKNMPVEHACAILCQYVRTSVYQMENLMSDMHVWKQK